jgi:hypothetical protein
LRRTTRWPGQRTRHQPGVDAGLRHRRGALALAHGDDLGARADVPEHGAARQGVVQHEVGRLQRLHSAQREQGGVARAGADQPDLAPWKEGAGEGRSVFHVLHRANPHPIRLSSS